MTDAFSHPLFQKAVRAYHRFVGPKRQAAMAGLLIGLAQPPFGFLPGLLGYALLLFSLDKDIGPKPLRRAFAIGWWAGFTYFFIGCFWVAEAFLVDAKSHGWMAPFAATLLPSGLALFWGMAFLIYRRFRPEGRVRWIFFAGLFCLFEVLRGTVFTGFPWNPAGSTFEAGSALSQMAAVVGIYGLSLLTVTVFSSLAVCQRQKGLKGYSPVLISALVLVLVFGFGAIRLRLTEVKMTETVVRIVQPNIGQDIKWSDGALDKIVTKYVKLSTLRLMRENLQSVINIDNKVRPDLIIWPEGALPAAAEEIFAPQSSSAKILNTLLKGDQTLFFGAYHQDYDETKGAIWRNSLLALHQKGEITELGVVYSKHKLVPFGEFLPFEKTLEKFGVKELVHVGDGFTPGPAPEAVKISDIPQFLPLICYEGLFTSLSPVTYIKNNDLNRPRWIINISNDAWFGPTTGPRQHLNLSSYRAIEEGLPMVRSTPTGISAMIDPLGRIVLKSKLDIGEEGYRDIGLPNSLTPTVYSKWRHLYLVFIVFFCLIPVTIRTFVQKTKSYS
jgi:apolipoprotein N-acyltransferase